MVSAKLCDKRRRMSGMLSLGVGLALKPGLLKSGMNLNAEY